MKKNNVIIPKFHESPALIRMCEDWRQGDNSPRLRKKLVRAYKDVATRGTFMKKSTQQFIEDEVLPLYREKTYRNIKCKWIRKLKNENNSH